MSRIDEAIQAKKDKRAALEAQEILAHPYEYDKQHPVSQTRQLEGKSVKTAGRVIAVRTHGKVTFFDVQDSTDTIQVMIREGELPNDQESWLNLVDRGDFIGVEGQVITTKTGELTIQAHNVSFLGKALRPLPTQWNAAEDKEARFRKRYLDMLINPQTKRVLDARWLIEKEIRRYLQDEHQFVEVETPVFQPLYGGTNATPFTTYMNALDSTFYLRLAPELYLKRLIVGGYDRIFEIARNFRNEGIDQTHQPEFTMMEWYETYADYNRVMDVAEGLFQHLAEKLYGSTTVQVGDQSIDIGGSWPRIPMKDSLLEHTDIDFDAATDEELRDILSQHNLELTGDFTRGKALFELFDKLVAHRLTGPVWIINYPRDISPLAKAHRSQEGLAERFEAYIGGKELADGWSEITDPIDQRNIFENEQRRMRAGDTEAHPLDEDFLEAMEYGMPPLGGIGLGIDRLVMFLTNTWSIKEVIAFPTLRPLPWQQPGLQAHQKNSPVQEADSNVSVTLPPRSQAETLMETHIQNEALRNHCRMVAQALEAYARKLGANEELWYQTGLLHDLDWEEYPDEHPNRAVAEWLANYPEELKNAILSHATSRTGHSPETQLDRYLFACDELSGFLNAYSLMRPQGFEGMEVKSVKKKLKDKAFAANVSRQDIQEGFDLIGKAPEEHIAFLIEVFS